MNPSNLFDQALALTKDHISVIPISTDGSKSPTIKWGDFQERIPDIGEIYDWFENQRVGIGAVTGKISDNLEDLDFDAPELLKPWRHLVEGHEGGAELLARLVVIATPRPGFAFVYRCPVIAGNLKLAQREVNGKVTTLIETRGQGGYFILPGSPPECHERCRPYVLKQGSLTAIPTITAEEREILHSSARMFNEIRREAKKTVREPASPNGNRPGDDYNSRTKWAEILEPADWKEIYSKGGETYWRRPGKKVGWSATTNHDGSDLFHVFSSNASPFESDTSYTKFAVFTFLNHNGDFQAAAKDLGGRGYGSRGSTGSETPKAKWPDPPADEAFYGLSGEIVRAIEEHSEADRVALLVHHLTYFGNIIGRSPHFVVESDLHTMNLFVACVGTSSKSRKGTTESRIRRLYEPVDEYWVKERIQDGLSSGEGLIWAVRDPIEKQNQIKGKGGRVVDYQTVIADPGVSDKRLLITQPEFASTLRVMTRDGNTLSATLRQSWDRGDLRIMTKNTPAKATGAHISIIAHVTGDELRRYLDRTEYANGFANRFLWVCVKRSKCLPEGGSDLDFGSLQGGLGQAIRFARTVTRMQRDDDARRVWAKVYPELSEGKPGLLGSVIARAEAQVVRLSCLYALLNMSSVIRREHLEAALALWEYCENSAQFIFGDATGDPTADELMRALRSNPSGLTRTEISDLFQRHKTGDEIQRALTVLTQAGLIRSVTEKTGGRPVERYFAIIAGAN